MEIIKKKTKTNQNKGFTLLELTVVVTLTSILGIAITAISMSTLLQASRTRRLVNIKETGNYATSQIGQLIRNAKTIDSCSSSNNTISFTNPDGYQTTIQEDTDKIASNSAFLTTSKTPLDSGSFNINCLPQDSNPNLIKISFTLTTSSTSNTPFEKPSVNFETSVSPRNYLSSEGY